jgi:hypothetical protein
MIRYAVMQRINDKAVQVGVILANNYSHANTKAMQLYNRHVWPERIATQ